MGTRGECSAGRYDSVYRAPGARHLNRRVPVFQVRLAVLALPPLRLPQFVRRNPIRRGAEERLDVRRQGRHARRVYGEVHRRDNRLAARRDRHSKVLQRACTENRACDLERLRVRERRPVNDAVPRGEQRALRRLEPADYRRVGNGMPVVPHDGEAQLRAAPAVVRERVLDVAPRLADDEGVVQPRLLAEHALEEGLDRADARGERPEDGRDGVLPFEGVDAACVWDASV